jgi:16S rRNA (guanine527-N7)-methyltransferase
VAWPSIRLTLLDATAKKTAFLAAVVDALELAGTDVLTGRAEELAHRHDLRESFDLVLARAVAPLPALLELTLPFARVGGRVVTPKGSQVDEEVAVSARAASVLEARLFVVPFEVPGPPQKLVIAVKQRPTPEAYPRRAGVPAKSPL